MADTLEEAALLLQRSRDIESRQARLPPTDRSKGRSWRHERIAAAGVCVGATLVVVFLFRSGSPTRHADRSQDIEVEQKYASAADWAAAQGAGTPAPGPQGYNNGVVADVATEAYPTYNPAATPSPYYAPYPSSQGTASVGTAVGVAGNAAYPSSQGQAYATPAPTPWSTFQQGQAYATPAPTSWATPAPSSPSQWPQGNEPPADPQGNAYPAQIPAESQGNAYSTQPSAQPQWNGYSTQPAAQATEPAAAWYATEQAGATTPAAASETWYTTTTAPAWTQAATTMAVYATSATASYEELRAATSAPAGYEQLQAATSALPSSGQLRSTGRAPSTSRAAATTNATTPEPLEVLPPLQPQHAVVAGGAAEFNFAKGAPQPKTVAGTKVVSGDVDIQEQSLLDGRPTAEVPPPDYHYANPAMTMYMYRAQGDQNYPLHNVNLANMAGVMWYLHNEIVGFPDPQFKIRHFNITRVIRFKVSIMNPPKFYTKHKTQFGQFTSFGAGKCNVPHCDSTWQTYGPVVGCQPEDPAVANYHADWQTVPFGTPMGADEKQCQHCTPPVWYSLPGPCPQHEYGAKSKQCMWDFPGGDCGIDESTGEPNTVTGATDCTFASKWAGEVFLDELLDWRLPGGGIGRFDSFTAAGGREYIKDDPIKGPPPGVDKGKKTSFWDGIKDKDKNDARMKALKDMFLRKYPDLPTELGERHILCDFNGWNQEEFGSLAIPNTVP